MEKKHKIARRGQPLLKELANFAAFLLTPPGGAFLREKLKKVISSRFQSAHELAYPEWIKARENTEQLQAEYEQAIQQMTARPNFTVIITTAGTNEKPVKATIASLLAQVYPKWTVSVVCDADLGRILERDTVDHDNMHLITRQPGQADPAIINSTLNDAPQGFVMFVEAGDMLSPACLLKLALHIAQHPTDDIIHFDEDQLLPDGTPAQPYFKPGWSPDTLLSRNYIGKAFVISTGALAELKGINASYTTQYTYDLLLRAAENNKKIGRIEAVLLHTAHPTAVTGETKKVLRDTLSRRGLRGEIEDVPGVQNGVYISYEVERPARVSIIIPTKDNADMLRTTLSSITELTAYPDYEIIVLDNNSTTSEFAQLMDEYKASHPHTFRCIPAHYPFNFARLMNDGAKAATGDYLLLLNNDVEVLQNDWLFKMVSYAMLPHTGAIGARLLFPDNTIQHAGITLGVGEISVHSFINQPADTMAHFGYVQLTNNVSAVTGACLMVRKTAWDEVHGMDEQLTVEFNDIDLCIKLLKAGYYNVYLPSVTLYHYESATRTHPFRSTKAWQQHKADLDHFRSKWGPTIYTDPFYNTNLTSEHTDFRQGKR